MSLLHCVGRRFVAWKTSQAHVHRNTGAVQATDPANTELLRVLQELAQAAEDKHRSVAQACCGCWRYCCKVADLAIDSVQALLELRPQVIHFTAFQGQILVAVLQNAFIAAHLGLYLLQLSAAPLQHRQSRSSPQQI